MLIDMLLLCTYIRICIPPAYLLYLQQIISFLISVWALMTFNIKTLSIPASVWCTYNISETSVLCDFLKWHSIFRLNNVIPIDYLYIELRIQMHFAMNVIWERNKKHECSSPGIHATIQTYSHTTNEWWKLRMQFKYIRRAIFTLYQIWIV